MKGEILPPLSATLHGKPRGWPRGLRLWLPLLLVGPILLGLLILLLPLLLLAALIAGVRVWGALRLLGRFVAAPRGSKVGVDSRRAEIKTDPD